MAHVKDFFVSPPTGYLQGMKNKGINMPKPTPARVALSINLKRLMADHRHDGIVGITSRQLGPLIGVSYKTLNRILEPFGDTDPNLTSLDRIAAFFKVQTWELLVPRQSFHSGTVHQIRLPEKHRA